MDEPQSSDAAQSGNQNGVSDRSRGIPILISTLRSITALRLIHHNIIILGVLLFVHKVLFPLTVCTLHHTLCSIPTLPPSPTSKLTLLRSTINHLNKINYSAKA